MNWEIRKATSGGAYIPRGFCRRSANFAASANQFLLQKTGLRTPTIPAGPHFLWRILQKFLRHLMKALTFWGIYIGRFWTTLSGQGVSRLGLALLRWITQHRNARPGPVRICTATLSVAAVFPRSQSERDDFIRCVCG